MIRPMISSALTPRPLPARTWPKASDEADGNTGRPQPGFFRITGKKYFVLYLSQAINTTYSTSGSLVFPDHRQKIFRTLPITGKKYFVLYLRWPAPAPIASKEPEKGKRYFGLYLLVGGRKPYTIWNPISCKDSWRDYPLP